MHSADGTATIAVRPSNDLHDAETALLQAALGIVDEDIVDRLDGRDHDLGPADLDRAADKIAAFLAERGEDIPAVLWPGEDRPTEGLYAAYFEGLCQEVRKSLARRQWKLRKLAVAARRGERPSYDIPF